MAEINQYMQPAQAQYINTYTPIPFESMLQAGMAQEQQYNQGKQAASSLYDQYQGIDVHRFDQPELERRLNQINSDISNLMAENPDLGSYDFRNKLDTYKRRLARDEWWQAAKANKPMFDQLEKNILEDKTKNRSYNYMQRQQLFDQLAKQGTAGLIAQGNPYATDPGSTEYADFNNYLGKQMKDIETDLVSTQGYTPDSFKVGSERETKTGNKIKSIMLDQYEPFLSTKEGVNMYNYATATLGHTPNDKEMRSFYQQMINDKYRAYIVNKRRSTIDFDKGLYDTKQEQLAGTTYTPYDAYSKGIDNTLPSPEFDSNGNMKPLSKVNVAPKTSSTYGMTSVYGMSGNVGGDMNQKQFTPKSVEQQKYDQNVRNIQSNIISDIRKAYGTKMSEKEAWNKYTEMANNTDKQYKMLLTPLKRSGAMADFMKNESKRLFEQGQVSMNDIRLVGDKKGTGNIKDVEDDFITSKGKNLLTEANLNGYTFTSDKSRNGVRQLVYTGTVIDKNGKTRNIEVVPNDNVQRLGMPVSSTLNAFDNAVRTHQVQQHIPIGIDNNGNPINATISAIPNPNSKQYEPQIVIENGVHKGKTVRLNDLVKETSEKLENPISFMQ